MIFLANRKKFVSFREKVLNYGYAQIIIWGLNFSFKRSVIRRKGVDLKELLLSLHYSYDMLFEIPKGIVVYVFKRRLVVYGHKRVLVSFIKKFTSLRSPNIYTGKGLRFRRLPFRKKPGKVRKR